MVEGETLRQRINSKLASYTYDEIAKHNKEDDAWVIVDGFVYDITDFIDEHPGGMSLVVEHLGTDITELLAKPTYHKHSPAAYSMLDFYKIGVVSEKKNLRDFSGFISPESRKGWGKVDFSRPFVHQVGLLGKEYGRWVATEPVHFKESVRMFGPDWMEATTHTKWYVPLLFWVPISMILFSIALFKLSAYAQDQSAFWSSLFICSVLWVIGYFSWFIMEYYIHKYLFHWDWLANQGYYLTNILHFLLHGMHHKVPMDKDRLVAPLALAVVIGSPMAIFVYSLFGAFVTGAFGAGFIMGYLTYDMMHYTLHHAGNPKVLPWPMSYLVSTKYFQDLRSHHLIHHFATTGHENNYGISNKYIDIVMGSLQSIHN